MFQIPAIPPAEGFHPFIVHFAVGILLSAWLPMTLCVVDVKRRQSWVLAGLMMLVLGTVFSFAAVFTGETAASVAVVTSDVVDQAVEQHEELAELSRTLFVGVVIVYVGTMVLHKRAQESTTKKKVAIVGSVLVCVSYVLSSLALANAGHQGGLLVHDLGIHAPVAPEDHVILPD